MTQQNTIIVCEKKITYKWHPHQVIQALMCVPISGHVSFTGEHWTLSQVERRLLMMFY